MACVLVLVGTEKGAFFLESNESRTEWSVRGPVIPGWDILDLTLDTRAEPTLYAAVGSEVYGPGIRVSKAWAKPGPNSRTGPPTARTQPAP